jgi:DNA gyrase/topoisomerase IV subunit A
MDSNPFSDVFFMPSRKWTMVDFNKVANVIGQTMQYHPHGDASIADAIINIGQKDIVVRYAGKLGRL